MLKTILAIVTLLAATWLASPEPSCAQSGSCAGLKCLGWCPGDCRCMQPDGYGTMGFCG